MLQVGEPTSEAPSVFRTRLQANVYETLRRLDIPFLRVETEPAVTMADCEAIDRALDVKTVKTLFLCNRRATRFVLFVTPGHKPFRTKDVSAALGVPRLSFAPEAAMEAMLGTKIGATTIFSVLLESSAGVQIAVDSDVAAQRWCGLSDGTTTGYMKLKTEHLLGDVLAAAGRTARVIDV